MAEAMFGFQIRSGIKPERKSFIKTFSVQKFFRKVMLKSPVPALAKYQKGVPAGRPFG